MPRLARQTTSHWPCLFCDQIFDPRVEPLQTRATLNSTLRLTSCRNDVSLTASQLRSVIRPTSRSSPARVTLSILNTELGSEGILCSKTTFLQAPARSSWSSSYKKYHTIGSTNTKPVDCRAEAVAAKAWRMMPQNFKKASRFRERARRSHSGWSISDLGKGLSTSAIPHCTTALSSAILPLQLTQFPRFERYLAGKANISYPTSISLHMLHPKTFAEYLCH
jgi:hypothetical protein